MFFILQYKIKYRTLYKVERWHVWEEQYLNPRKTQGKLKLKFFKMFITTPIILLLSAAGVWGHARIDSPVPRLVSNIRDCS
jgi:hypothetical protein